jgi:uncharacterized membrane protein
MEFAGQLAGRDAPPYKDRSTALIVFGIFEILGGVLCLMLIPLMFFGQAMSARMTGGPPQYSFVIAPAFAYGLIASTLVTVGIGSIRARRWARALSLIVGWSWLVMGSLAVIVDAFVIPKALARGAPGAPGINSSLRIIITLFAIGFMLVIFVLIPLVVVLFYKRPDVRATCEARDPVMRWTDQCPLPVLALSMWLAFGGLFLVLMPAAYHGVAPFFGTLISGIPGAVFYLSIAALFFYLARSLYRVQPSSWWLTLGLMLLFGVSNVLTFAQVDLMEMYRQMGYPEAQIKQMQGYNFMDKNVMMAFSALGFLPALGYLLFIRRFFDPARLQSA